MIEIAAESKMRLRRSRRRVKICYWPPVWREWPFPAPVWEQRMRWRTSRERRCMTAAGNAMLLPTVLGFNRMVCRERFGIRIGRALTVEIGRSRCDCGGEQLIAEVGPEQTAG